MKNSQMQNKNIRSPKLNAIIDEIPSKLTTALFVLSILIIASLCFIAHYILTD